MLNTEKLCPFCMNDCGGEKVCPICGKDTAVQNTEDCLPIRMVIDDRYTVGAAIRRNGEGITYTGWDNSGDNIVEILEYFPTGFAVRNPDKTVGMVKGGEYTFNEGLLEFLDINRQIKGSELPSLIPVTDVFEENGTVYAVSKRISVISLKKFLAKNGGELKWEQARALFLPLIDTVKGMNDLGIIHGGISTETILVGHDGKLRLSGYAVKGLRSAKSKLDYELFEGFAAIEQYSTNDIMVSPATDVYALCAVLFNVLIGSVPAVATDRLQNDSMSIPSRFAEELPRHVLSALANGLQVLPENRTRNIEGFKNELVYAETVTAPKKAPAKKSAEKEDTKAAPKSQKKGGSAKYVMISSVCTAVAFLVIVAVLIFTVFREDVFGPKNPSALSSNSSTEAPSVDAIGTIDSGAEESAVLFNVPSVIGKYYAEIFDNEDYEKFEFVIKGKEFNDKYQRGQICAQSIAEGTGVVRDTKIEITISLGSKEIKIANLLGLKENEAKLELLKQGFLYDNIEVLEKYDEEKESGAVLEQEPKYGTQVSTDTAVKIYINSYKDESGDSSSSSSDR